MAATAALWWARPGEASVLPALLMAGIATVGAEAAFIFYNAMLPSVAGERRMGRWSGWAWALGYAGGLACLLVALFGFVEEGAWLGLPREEAEHVRATFPLVALWYGLFALPLFLLTPDQPAVRKPIGGAVRDGLAQLGHSLRQARAYGPLARFLIARMLFIDGLATIFAFGGVYAAGTFGMDERQVLLFGIALNVTAGLGAGAFAWVDDRIGSKTTIILALIGLIGTGTGLLLAQTSFWFWALGLLLGVFVGPAQAAGRSYLGHAAPAEVRSQLFGLFAFSGKATTFAGPLLVGWITAQTGSQRIGMSVVVVMLLGGLLLMLAVPSPESVRSRLARIPAFEAGHSKG